MDQQKKQCITHYIGIFFKIAQAHQAYICRFCSRCIGPDLASIMAIGLLILRKKLQCYRKRCSHCISPGLEPIIAMGLLILPNKLQGCSSFHACCSYGAFRSVQKKKTMRSLRHHSVVQFVTAITQDIHMMIVSEIHQQVIYSAMPFSPWETKLPYSSDQQVILSMALFISTTTKPVSLKQVG